MERREAVAAEASRLSRTRWFWAIGGALLLAILLLIRAFSGPHDAAAGAPAQQQPTANRAAPTNQVNSPEIVALVNNEEIGRQELAKDCLRMFGKEVLDNLINKQLIVEYCQRSNIVITGKDVDEEISHMAKKFNLPVDQWLNLLKQERNITPQQYSRDVVWPMLALKRIAAGRLMVTETELREAFDSEYGPAVQCRMIVCEDPRVAKEAYAKALQNPDDFPNLAKNYSSDVNVASSKGVVPPIRKNLGSKELENAAFSLKEGEVSKIVQADRQFIILKCEMLIPPVRPTDMDMARTRLEDMIKERKLQRTGGEVFQSLQKSARIENYLTDPAAGQNQPGVAAMVNGQKITMRELAEECVERHGAKVLDAVIGRKLLEQNLTKNNLRVTQKHLDQEIASAAVAMGKIKPNGDPDVQAWLAVATEDNKIPMETYIQTAVWPSAALKLIVGDSVKISNEDLQKGYEANYGPRVRCRAIVLNNHRKAQEVWGLARDKRTVEYFGQLAEQYSIEPSSKSLQGKVPPIQMHGGQPTLEKEAFALQPGEISGIVQLNDKFVILFCEGRTEPTKVKFEEVRDLIYEDLFDKKLQLAMNDAYRMLKDQSMYVNQLTGETHTPKSMTGPKNDSRVQPAVGFDPNGRPVTPTSATGPIMPRK